MPISRFLHWHAARVLVVAVAVVGTLLLIGGRTNATPPGGTIQLTNAIVPAPTTTKLVASPVSPVPLGTLVTLTATVALVAPGTVQFPGAPGTVQFMDGPNPLGTPKSVSNGIAFGTISQLPVGPHQLTAAFIPANPAAFAASTSSPAVPFEVTGPPKQATDTQTVLITSASSVTQGEAVTLTATVTPTAAPGTVQFKDGADTAGTPVTVSNGRASTPPLILPVGARQLTAEFKPSDQTSFSPSKSLPVSLTVIDSSQTVTSQAQQSGQSLDGPTALDGPGLTVLDLRGLNDGGGVALLDGGNASDGRGLLNLGGLTDGRGVTLLDGGNASDGRGLTVLNLGGLTDGRLTDGRGPTVLGGQGLTVLRTGRGGLLSNLLRGLL